ncbi:hypothetical protein Y1U_C0639 [Streptococcus thermophilus MN-ZLW-002]|nr:hypothetical protein Y1U_C0639 [Streptococcus thermophilus MN-ZLW-002]
MYSQDLSNCTTGKVFDPTEAKFLYSQDLSNCTTMIYNHALDQGFCTLKI